MRVVLAQINPTVGDLKGNCAKIIEFVNSAEALDADIVAFPEMVVTGYPPEDLLLKEHFIKDNLKAVHALAKKIKGIAAVVGFVEKDRAGSLYNAAAVISNGKICGVYRKEHLPNYGVFDEKRYFSQGKNEKIFALGGKKFGVNICEDIWIDRGSYQKQVKSGAQFIINISSSPFDVEKLNQRGKLLKRRANEIKKYLCYVNLVGGQDELVFDGGSLVVDPKGKIVASGKLFAEDMVVVDLDIKPARKGSKKIVRLGRGVTKKERTKLDTHHFKKLPKIQRIYQALVLGTRDYVQKNGFKKVLIGLSGGIDSSVVAAIAAESVGKENVVGVTMPSNFSSNETRADAVILAENLGIKFYEIPIQHVFNAYMITMAEPFSGNEPNTAEENIQARIRGNILMALSNKFGWLVLTTGNKSEIAVGYCTLYGDMSGGFAVIKDVPKTQVFEIARLINIKAGNIIPGSVISRPPTAELRENQTDQDSLPAYAVLDKMLKKYVEEHGSLADVSRTSNLSLAKEIIHLVDLNEYKRRQAPPGIKISQRAFGKDWRLPITNKYKEF